MSASRRNVLVGITVLGSLVILAWMLLKFGTAPVKMFQNKQQIQVHFIADRADGLAAGAQVVSLGVTVGQVTELHRDDNLRNVLITADVDITQPLPANIEGAIRTLSMLSGATELSLELIGGPNGQPQGQLVSGMTLKARYVGSDLIPPQIGTLATELGQTTEDIRKAQLVTHINDTVRDADDVLKSLNTYIADPKLRDDLRTAIANFRQVTDSATRSAANIEKFSDRLQKVTDDATDTLADARTTIHKTQGNLDILTQQLDDRLLQAGKLLDSFQSIAAKVDKGQGTAGLLVNDPKLYESLVDTSRELNATITDLKRVIEQWEQEGVYLKLK